MMEAVDDGLGNNMTKPFDRAAKRRVLPEGEVRAGTVVVASIRHDPEKMYFAEHNYTLASEWLTH